MVIALEGASAVGKSTTAKMLEEVYGFEVVPEVNELFERAHDESNTWYLERQVDRWRVAKEISESGGRAVLDGDTFQPVWYNAIFRDKPLQPIEDVIDFYSSVIEAGHIAYPNKYYVLLASKEDLEQRKQADLTRNRSNFEKHLQLVQPQVQYFRHMAKVSSNIVEFIETSKVEKNVELISRDVVEESKIEAGRIFSSMVGYIEMGAM